MYDYYVWYKQVTEAVIKANKYTLTNDLCLNNLIFIYFFFVILFDNHFMRVHYLFQDTILQ